MIQLRNLHARLTRSVVLLIAVVTVMVASAGQAAAHQPASEAERLAAEFIAHVDDLAILLDEIWAEIVAELGFPYTSPGYVLHGDGVETACGVFEPGEWIAYYCIPDATVYLDVIALAEASFDYGLVAVDVVIAHTWGWHVQTQLELEGDDYRYLLRAECLAGAWIAAQEAMDELEPEDLELALAFVADAGDDELRVEWFLAGYDDVGRFQE